MKPKSLLMLLVVTLLVSAAAVLSVNQGKTSSATAEEAGLLLPELSAVIDDVVAMEITKGGASATLVREDGVWVCRETSGYPADFDKLKEALLALKDLRVIESKTRKPERHAKLGLDEASGAAVVLRDAGGEVVASVVVGDTVYSRDAQRVYARLGDEDQAYLCEGDLTLSGDASTWINTEIVRLDSARPQTIHITHADGETLDLSKAFPAAPNWEVIAVPDDRQLKSEAIANSMGTALSFLSFDEVRPAADVALGTNHVADATFNSFDGLRIDLRVARIEEENWVTLEAGFEPPPDPVEVGPAPEGEPKSEEDVARQAALDQRNQGLAGEAAAMQAGFEGWTYRIPQYKADLFLRRMEDLLAEVEVGPPAEAASEQSGFVLEEAILKDVEGSTLLEYQPGDEPSEGFEIEPTPEIEEPEIEPTPEIEEPGIEEPLPEGADPGAQDEAGRS